MLFGDLNDREAGRTVFVVGAGPQLAALSPAVLAALSARATVCVNLTQYRVRPRYFLSAYVDHVILAQARAPEAVLIHMRRHTAPPLLPFITALRRRSHSDGMRLTRRLSGPRPTLFTRRNVALAATHLAFILGARRIVYFGVEQRNARYFYTVDTDVGRQILADLAILDDYRQVPRDHSYRTVDRIRAKIAAGDAALAARPFYDRDHTPAFRAYFGDLRAAGVEVFSTVREGVVVDAGGDYLSPEEAVQLPDGPT